MRFRLLFSMLCLILLSACITDEQLGYPESVTVSAKGEESIINGKKNFTYIAITVDGTDHVDNSIGRDSICARYDWLEVKGSKSETKLYLKAQPNPGATPRKLQLKGMGPHSRTYIEVLQEGGQ